MTNLTEIQPENLEKMIRDSVEFGLTKFQELVETEIYIEHAYIKAQTHCLKRFLDLYMEGCN